jgi:hypothetical protein
VEEEIWKSFEINLSGSVSNSSKRSLFGKNGALDVSTGRETNVEVEPVTEGRSDAGTR